jgi:hypothetical protein
MFGALIGFAIWKTVFVQKLLNQHFSTKGQKRIRHFDGPFFVSLYNNYEF